MKYTAYVVMEPGMDRPCFSHKPPTPAVYAAYKREGMEVYQFELDIPMHELIDGKLKKVVAVPYVPPEDS